MDEDPWTVFNFSVVFAVKLASRYICFKYLDCVKRVIFQASDMAKILRLIARNKDFRQRYLCLPEVVDKICCLRSTRIRLHNSK